LKILEAAAREVLMQLIARNSRFRSAKPIRRLHEYALYALAACLLWFILVEVMAPVVRQPAADRVATETTACDRCGVIEAVRKTTRNATRAISVESGYGSYAVALLSLLVGAKYANPTAKEAGPATNYEITVRFNDGSRRVLTQSNPPKWKAGDRVMVVNGEIRPIS
jgi:hypothetical protein